MRCVAVAYDRTYNSESLHVQAAGSNGRHHDESYTTQAVCDHRFTVGL